MVSTCPLTLKSSSPFNNALVTVPKNTNHEWYNFHLHVPQIFHIPSKVEVLILLFTLLQSYSVISWDSKVHNFASSFFFFFFFLLMIIRSGLLSRLGDPFVCQSLIVCACYSPGQKLDFVYTIARMAKCKFLAHFPVDHLAHIVVSAHILLC